MLHYAPALLMLLHLAVCFPREKTTQKPAVPSVVNPKNSRPTHISEFTDPDTGLNPFVDIEEGPVPPLSRNIMEDERRDDEPYFDLDLVEGDGSDRRWNLPKENLGRIPGRQPEVDYKDESEIPVRTTPFFFLPNPPTTVELPITKGIEHAKTEAVDEGKELPHEIIKEEEEPLVISQSSVIYATATISVLTVIILLAGACWWRRKLKRSSTSTAESAEVKS